jgi:hypothetical protein
LRHPLLTDSFTSGGQDRFVQIWRLADAEAGAACGQSFGQWRINIAGTLRRQCRRNTASRVPEATLIHASQHCLHGRRTASGGTGDPGRCHHRGHGYCRIISVRPLVMLKLNDTTHKLLVHLMAVANVTLPGPTSGQAPGRPAVLSSVWGPFSDVLDAANNLCRFVDMVLNPGVGVALITDGKLYPMRRPAYDKDGVGELVTFQLNPAPPPVRPPAGSGRSVVGWFDSVMEMIGRQEIEQGQAQAAVG